MFKCDPNVALVMRRSVLIARYGAWRTNLCMGPVRLSITLHRGLRFNVMETLTQRQQRRDVRQHSTAESSVLSQGLSIVLIKCSDLCCALV